jgi:hypothetical protein
VPLAPDSGPGLSEHVPVNTVIVVKRFSAFLVLFLLFSPALLLAEPQLLQDDESVQVTLKDSQGERLEGYLRLPAADMTVAGQDNKDKAVSLKIIESIKLEKVTGGVPGADQPGVESYYSVRLQNSQEIFRLSNKYTFLLNTQAGVLTKTIDPKALQEAPSKESLASPKANTDKPFIRDKSVILSLEMKF